jgi:predicted AlkP superfamily pyrophosphatase or phosphodiesterase
MPLKTKLLPVLMLSLLGAAAAAVAKPAVDQGIAGRQGYFISIDGLNPAHLQTMLEHGKLTAPHGFKWLERHTTHIKKLEPVYTTLTAASHISTVTCSTPSRHGIIANSFITNGEKVSGYSHDFKSEALWEAAKRQGKSVVALAYVGADGLSERRSADYGLGYPEDEYLGKAQTLTWDLSAMPAATGWTTAGEDLAAAREQAIEIKVDAATAETAVVQALAVPAKAGEAAAALVYLDTDKDLTNGYIGKLQLGNAELPVFVHHYFIESAAGSPLKGYKRTAFFRALPAGAGQLSVYVSASSYNSAYPAAFRQALDDANLVWPNYGVSSDKLTPVEKIEANAIFDRYVTKVATFATARYHQDIMLFYQPLIDTLGHSYESKLPLPFDPDATDEISQAYVRAFQIVDENLSELLGGMHRQDVVELMGDHGMDPIKRTVNVAALLTPEQRAKVDVVSSGTLVLVYPKQADAAGQLVTQTAETIAAADQVGQELYLRLRDLQFEGDAVFGAAQRQTPRTIYGAESPSGYGDDWQYGEALWALMGASGYWYRYSEIEAETFGEPPAYGMHGNFIDVPTMDTTGFVGGPGFRHGEIERGRLLDMTPTFSGLMGLEAPRDCMGTSLAR